MFTFRKLSLNFLKLPVILPDLPASSTPFTDAD
jgi:hypothetical protein